MFMEYEMFQRDATNPANSRLIIRNPNPTAQSILDQLHTKKAQFEAALVEINADIAKITALIAAPKV